MARYTRTSKEKKMVLTSSYFAEGEDRAIERAKKLTTLGNPSTTVYKLIEALRVSHKE